MDLPINDKELNTIVSALRLGGDAALYQKLKIIKEIREENPGGAYKRLLVNSLDLLFDGLFKRNCKRNWR